MIVSATALAAGLCTTLTCMATYCCSVHVSPHFSSSYARMTRPQQRDWDSRLPSTLHALAITLASMYALGVADTFDSGRLAKAGSSVMLAKSQFTEAAIGMSLGYFLCDVVVIARNWAEASLAGATVQMGSTAIMVHHAVATLSLVGALASQQAHGYTLLLLATELTTPFINARWQLDALGFRRSKAYMANALAIVVSWALGRILLSLGLFRHMYLHRSELSLIDRPEAGSEFCGEMGSTGQDLVITVPPILFSLNLFWFVKICKGFWKAVQEMRPQSAPRPKSVETGWVHVDGGVSTAGKPLDGKLRQRAAAATAS